MRFKISVDPGVTGTGYAVWWDDTKRQKTPVDTGILIPGSYYDGLPERLLQLEKGLQRVVNSCGGMVTQFAVEWPSYFSSGKGNTSAARGDLGKLYGAATTAVLSGMRCCHNVELIDVVTWKGQLPKPIVVKRIMKILQCGDKAYKSHEWDAIGIGLYAFFGFWREENDNGKN